MLNLLFPNPCPNPQKLAAPECACDPSLLVTPIARLKSVPCDMPMKHDFPRVLIDLDYRITPTEIGVQVVEPDWHRQRCYRRQKPCWIHEKHRRPSKMRFS